MYVLGISAYVFDSAACLLKDGKVVAAAQEERFTREKNTGDFPENAIRFCLKYADISIEDVEHVSFYWSPFKGIFNRAGQIIKNLPKSLRFWGSHSDKWASIYRSEKELKKRFPGKHKFKYHFVPHHLSHAASTFFVSPFRESNIIIIDGSGEIEASSYGFGQDNKINFFNKINFPQSLGYLYVSLTHYLGFKPDSDEYKVMGLASMGEESEYYIKMKDIVSADGKGKYDIDMSYFNYQKGVRDPWVSEKFIKSFGAMREKNSPLEKKHQDIAWALQKRLEDIVIEATNYLYEKTNCENLVIAGGCALNCAMTEQVRLHSKIKNVWLMSAPHDAGASMGSALWLYHSKLGFKRKFVYESALLGPEFTREEIKEVLEDNHLDFEELTEEETLKKTAKLLSEKNIIGWFQGRAEFGPRALGSRSILADPRDAKMKDKINLRIKHREEFRPFAPAVLEEKSFDYFDVEARKLPFMTFVVGAKAKACQDIPAVVHFDKTSRIQTVSKDVNNKFYNLIEEFQGITGVPVLLNTSFNDSGEPIVNTPKDALKSFKRTNLDYLVMGNFILKRQ